METIQVSAVPAAVEAKLRSVRARQLAIGLATAASWAASVLIVCAVISMLADRWLFFTATGTRVLMTSGGYGIGGAHICRCFGKAVAIGTAFGAYRSAGRQASSCTRGAVVYGGSHGFSRRVAFGPRTGDGRSGLARGRRVGLVGQAFAGRTIGQHPQATGDCSALLAGHGCLPRSGLAASYEPPASDSLLRPARAL